METNHLLGGAANCRKSVEYVHIKKKTNLCLHVCICKGRVLENTQQTLNSEYLGGVGQNVSASFKFHVIHLTIFEFVTMDIYY